jgi:hypothetical protein
MDNFRSHGGSFFLMNKILLHCIQIYLKNLTKMRRKFETYISIFQAQKKKKTKMINVQFKVDFTKYGTLVEMKFKLLRIQNSN